MLASYLQTSKTLSLPPLFKLPEDKQADVKKKVPSIAAETDS